MDDIVLSTIRLSVPLLFAALGGLLSERAGVANIALEGFILVSAFVAAATVHLSQSLFLGVTAAVLVTMVAGLLFATVCILTRADQIVIGTAFNLFAIGGIPVISRALFAQTGSTPSLPLELRFHQPLWFASFAIVAGLALHFLISSTPFGLRVRAAGDFPEALLGRGISVDRLRAFSITIGSGLLAFAGVYVSTCQASGYTRGMAGGRGFIALAALIFGGWKPIPTVLACLFFGFVDAIQIQVQNLPQVRLLVPDQLIQVFPYVLTLAILAMSRRNIRAPSAINSAR